MYTVTPLIYSQYLKNTIGKDVYFKVETMQPVLSFKIRGIGRLCQYYRDQGYRRLVASSGGNAGIAVAYAGRMLDIPVKVFIPESSHAIYVNEIESYGASVEVRGNVWREAHEAAMVYAENNDGAYVPPFDHPEIWAGHASMIAEVAQTGIKPDAVITAVGGGGLACGLLQGMSEQGWTDVSLVGVETEGASALDQTIRAGERVMLDHISSRATSLGASQITEKLYQWLDKHPIYNAVVTDEQAEEGCWAFARDKRVLTELSAGTSLSVVYEDQAIIRFCETVLVIVCGGANTQFLLNGK